MKWVRPNVALLERFEKTWIHLVENHQAMSFRTRTPPAVSPFSLRLHVLSYGFVLGAMLVVQSSHAQITVTAEQRWATYLGGEADDQVLSVATDAFGHVYVAGRTSNGLRLGNDTTDASGLTHQDTLGGGASDAFLAKIAPQGSMLWCTYFGGAGDDEAVQVVVTDMDGVYLVGNTTSTEAIATDSLGLQTVPGGNGDLFVARFTEYGRLLGATYLGGSDVETATGAALDGLGRLVVCGSSDGPNSFTNGPLPVQPFDEGSDGLLFTLHSTDSLVSGTYLGGAGDDVIMHMAQGDSTGIVLVGNTTSAMGIATAEAAIPAPLGGTDGFMMKLDTNLTILYGTYFGGGQDDRINGIARYADRFAICGISWSDSLLVDSTVQQHVNAGGGDGFFALLDSVLAVEMYTFVGDTAMDALASIAFDQGGSCYAVGLTSSAVGMATANGEGASLKGPSDAFVLRYDSAQALTWSRYLGAMQEEEGRALVINGYTSVLVGGRTSSTSGFTSLGHQMEFGGGDQDGSLVRLDQAISTPCSGICTGTSTGNGSGGTCNGVSNPLPQFDLCLGESVSFIAYGGALGAGATWMWYANGCGIPEQFLTSGDTITIAPTSSFTLSVRAESQYGASPCESTVIIVHTYPTPTIAISDSVCGGAAIDFFGQYADAFTWELLDTLLQGPQAQLIAPWITAEVPVVVTATNGPSCSVTVLDSVMVNSPTPLLWQVTPAICTGASDAAIAVDSASFSGLTITWANSNMEGTTITNLLAGSYAYTLLDSAGCSLTDAVVVTEAPALIDSLIITDATCNTMTGSAQVITTSTSPGLQFAWGNGPPAEPLTEGLLPGYYTVTATDSMGCVEHRNFQILADGFFTAMIQADTIWADDGIPLLQCIMVPMDNAAIFIWTPTTGLADPTASSTTCTVLEPTTYTVHVLSSAGCMASDSVVVMPRTITPRIDEPPCGAFFLPDHFSPNGDGLNDALCVLGNCFSELQLNIYDRWGQRVFTSTVEDPCWDGTNNGANQETGPYAFTLRAVRIDGDVIEQAGTITLQK